MRQCQYCSHFEHEVAMEDNWVSNYCWLLQRTVSRTASCNHYSARITAENSGYTGDDGGCFLTSACVDYIGKGDDCEELTILRDFRDNYMKKSAVGSELVTQYYEVAPKIVESINNSANKEYFYKYIYGVIINCIKLIKENNNEDALSEYKKMVVKLKKELCC